MPRALIQEDDASYRDLLNASGPFHLVVTRRLSRYGPVPQSGDLNSPDLEISLYSTRERVGLLNKLIEKFSSSIKKDLAKYLCNENEIQAPSYESILSQASVLLPITNSIQLPCSGSNQEELPPLLLEPRGDSPSTGYMWIGDKGPSPASSLGEVRTERRNFSVS